MAKSITKMNEQEFQEWFMSDPETNFKKLYTKEYINSIKWSYVPLKTIQKYKDLVDWNIVSRYRQLSEPFIERHKSLVNWTQISTFQQLSDTFIEAHKNELNMSLVNDNWLNKDTEFKKKAVIDTGLYECHEDYFIAYKGIRSDRYSAFNFQYKYLPGNTYTCFADGSRNENSFGLSVWNESNARDYCSELIVKCKVFYEDVARVVHDGGKIRCSKITILD